MGGIQLFLALLAGIIVGAAAFFGTIWAICQIGAARQRRAEARALRLRSGRTKAFEDDFARRLEAELGETVNGQAMVQRLRRGGAL
jgi:hypothetical protein